MSETRYISIQEWMLELGIGGNDLLAYALVWGFCQNKTSHYSGSYDYIAYWLGCEHRTVRRIVAKLVDAGLLRKEERWKDGKKVCDLYALVPSGQNVQTRLDKMSEDFGQNVQTGVDKMSHHNNSIEINNRDNNKTPLPPFDFYKALINAGVTPETAEAWLQVRKAKRSVNSELAFRETMKEVRKSGRSAEECIRFSAARSWAGFMAQWLEREENGTGTARARKPRDGDAMMRMYEKLTRSSQPDPNDLPDLPDEQ